MKDTKAADLRTIAEKTKYVPMSTRIFISQDYLLTMQLQTLTRVIADLHLMFLFASLFSH